MKIIEINSNERTDIGKNLVNKIRNKGLVPAVLYGTEPKTLTVALSDAIKLYNARHENFLIKLKINNDIKDALLKDIQLNPVKNNVIHLDFLELVAGKPIAVKIPIQLTGTPMGIKLGGIIEHFLWEVKIECLPKNIPEFITIDISNLNIGESIHIEDLKVPQGVKVLDKAKQVIVTIGLPSGIAEEKEAEAAAAAEAEAAEAAAAAEGAEKEGGAPVKGQGAPVKGQESKTEQAKGAPKGAEPVKGKAEPAKGKEQVKAKK